MAVQSLENLLVVASTLPANADDPVPAFVRDQIIALKAAHPELKIHILAPHNAYSPTRNHTQHADYQEYRFHYFWPHSLERLTGRGIAPALKAHKWLYLVVPFLFLCEMTATYRLARKVRPDLLYVHWFTPQAIAVAPVAKKFKIPLVFTSHASDVAVLKKVPGARRLVAAICRQAVAYTAVSEQTADRLRRFWTAESAQSFEAKLSIIPMGTDVAELPAATNSLPEFDGQKVILFVGRIVERKGLFDLAQAFRDVVAVHPEAVLVFAGEGQDKERLQKQIVVDGLSKKVVFPGYISGQMKADLLARADVVCLPSINEGAHAEGLPVVFMEALAAGKVIVASDVTGAQEYLHSGEDGFVFPERDVEALKSTLLTTLQLRDDERKDMQTKARQLADNFKWPKVAEAHYTVLSDAYQTYNSK